MLIPILLFLLTPVSVPQEGPMAVDPVNGDQLSPWHVPGTPPPAPRRGTDTPPVIKDDPLPPV